MDAIAEMGSEADMKENDNNAAMECMDNGE
jgi:hypothetical protein